MLVGVCGRNDHNFQDSDVRLIEAAGIELVKMMSFTNPASFAAVRTAKPDCQFIVRLYDGRIGRGYHTSPQEFVDVMAPVMESLRQFTDLFEVHNEPNHLAGIEGWGQEDHHARDFNDWFLDVVYLLDVACPWAKVGFPGLAIPHRDIEWLEICSDAILAADWLGCHNYWQNPTSDDANHLSDDWGLRFKRYHQNYPDKPLHITEFGNSNCQNPALPFDRPTVAREYVEYYQELFKHPYVESASSFLMSAPQEEWSDFCWRDEGGHFHPVVGMVGAMDRPEKELPPDEPEPPATDDLASALRREAWKQVGVPWTPDFALSRYAREHGLGSPRTEEVRLTVRNETKGGIVETYALQGFDGGIVWALEGQWDKIVHIEW